MINAGLSKYDIQVLKGLIGNQFIRFRSQEIDNWGQSIWKLRNYIK